MACPVCFTGDDPVVRESLTAGIGVLVGITLVVLTAFASFFVVLARRARVVSAGGGAAGTIGAIPAPSSGHPWGPVAGPTGDQPCPGALPLRQAGGGVHNLSVPPDSLPPAPGPSRPRSPFVAHAEIG